VSGLSEPFQLVVVKRHISHDLPETEALVHDIHIQMCVELIQLRISLTTCRKRDESSRQRASRARAREIEQMRAELKESQERVCRALFVVLQR